MTFPWKPPSGWEKTAELQPAEDRPSYPSRVWHTLPKAVFKAATDVPIGAVETKVSAAVMGKPETWAAASKKSLGSSTGHILAASTAPLFFDGLQESQSDDPSTRRMGVTKVVGSGVISNALKGVTEGVSHKLPVAEAVAMRAVSGIPGILGALATAKEGKKDSSRSSKYLKGAAIGGLAGAVKGGVQGAYLSRGLLGVDNALFRRSVSARGLGQAAGGALSGGVLAAILDYAKRKDAPAAEKVAALEAAAPPTEGLLPATEIRPHQERLIQKVVNNGGVGVAAHGVGTGKSFASIATFDRLKRYGMANRLLVVTPAGLKKNYTDAVGKFSNFSVQMVEPKGSKNGVYMDAIDPNKSVTVVSYDMFRQNPDLLMQRTGADMLILDEYHKVRDPTGSTYKAAVAARKYAPNFLGLTGSITNNDPGEIVPLANLAAGRVIMRPSQFNARYKRTVAKKRGFFGGKGNVTALHNVPDIKKQFGRYVDFLTTEDVGGDMPRKKVDEIRVPMSPEQQKIYEFALSSVDPLTARKIRENLPMDYKEAAQVFTMIQKARQAANSIAPFQRDVTLAQAADRTPKVSRLIADLQDHMGTTPDGQAILYSNLINGGVDVLDAALTARGIEHAVFVGKDREIAGEKVTSTVRDQGVQDFLAGKKKVIVVSPAGAEGLDLRNATLFQSLDGHFNPERTRQAEARGRRLGGLSHRPPEAREVQVKRYFSVYPQAPLWKRALGRRQPTTTDEWINSVALEKHHLNTQLTSAFKQPVASGVPLKPADIPAAPPKYIRRWKDDSGDWRYAYAN